MLCRILKNILLDFLDLLYPQFCVGCGVWDTALCIRCIAKFSVFRPVSYVHLPLLNEVGAGDDVLISLFPVFSLGVYRDVLASIVRSWKNSNSAELDAKVGALCQSVLMRANKPISAYFPATSSGRKLVIMSVPSAWQRRHADRLVAQKLAWNIASYFNLEYVDALYRQQPFHSYFRQLFPSRFRPASWQVRLAKQYLPRVQKNLVNFDVILVDDVTTSGATLLGCARAVSLQGGQVVGAFVLANSEKH